jgi:hypothetical protein
MRNPDENRDLNALAILVDFQHPTKALGLPVACSEFTSESWQ